MYTLRTLNTDSIPITQENSKYIPMSTTGTHHYLLHAQFPNIDVICDDLLNLMSRATKKSADSNSD